MHSLLARYVHARWTVHDACFLCVCVFFFVNSGVCFAIAARWWCHEGAGSERCIRDSRRWVMIAVDLDGCSLCLCLEDGMCMPRAIAPTG